MALKVCLVDKCVFGMHGDRESSSVTDRIPLQTLEYKVSLFCQNIYIYTLTISFDDGIMSN
jgi:hypothetical protein